MEKEAKIALLKERAKELRKTALTMIYEANSGHPGGSLSAADLMAALYFDELRLNPENPRWEDRDRFVLSKGHVCPILYSALALRGFFPYETIHTLRKYGSILQGHPDMKRCPGVDISTGSLGQGISCAVGMAIAYKRDKKDARVFAMLGDGETNEGQVWEAVEAAVKYGLDNLVIIVDNNGLQNDGACADIMPTQDLCDKFKAFGCRTFCIDGHDMEQIVSVFEKIRMESGCCKPFAVVAKTVKGKGVSFMENVVKWHGVAPNDDEYKMAMAELEVGLK